MHGPANSNTCLSSASPATARRARELLKDGYQRLAGYEVDGGGFDWFGDAPAHEVLTAYGLMEFTEMARYIDVDEKMLERTRKWLLSRRDGEGGFRAAEDGHSFGRAPAEIRNAYILFALGEAGTKADLSPELTRLASDAKGERGPLLPGALRPRPR